MRVTLNVALTCNLALRKALINHIAPVQYSWIKPFHSKELSQACLKIRIIELFTLCKGGNFYIHSWVCFDYFI